MQGQKELASSLQAVITKTATPKVPFTAASPSAVDNLLRRRHIAERPPLPLPQLSDLLPASLLEPFNWGTLTETRAAPDLLQKLREWVVNGAIPPISNEFLDVQGLASHAPLHIYEPHIGDFKGINDMVILNSGLSAAEIVSPMANCAVAVDWKVPSKLATAKHLAALQAIGLSVLRDEANSPPLFFTDLCTGFRCWRLIDNDFCCYKGINGSLLTLAEGVALIRYFLIAETEMLHSQKEHLLVVGAPHSATASPANTVTAGISKSTLSSASGTSATTTGAFQNTPENPVTGQHTYDSPADEIELLKSITINLAHSWAFAGGFNMQDACN